MQELEDRWCQEHPEPCFIPLAHCPGRVIRRYVNGMKTAISLPDDLFQTADVPAERLGLSRSELYAIAVAEYLAKHRDEDIAGTLNEVYPHEPSGMPPALRSAHLAKPSAGGGPVGCTSLAAGPRAKCHRARSGRLIVEALAPAAPTGATSRGSLAQFLSSLKSLYQCEPSQNGLFFDPPHRQSVTCSVEAPSPGGVSRSCGPPVTT